MPVLRRCSLCMWTAPPVPPPHRRPETLIWAGCWLALSLTYPLFGYQPDPLGAWQWMAWHIFAVWYVLARCGMLAQGHSGSLVLLDGLAGCFRLPFGNFFLQGAHGVFCAENRPAWPHQSP